MRNRKLFGIIAIVAVIGLVLAGCARDPYIYRSADFEYFEFTERPLEDVMASIPRHGVHNIRGYYISEAIFTEQVRGLLGFDLIDGRSGPNMDISNIPEGLSPGQRVRVYYLMFSSARAAWGDPDMLQVNQGWTIHAIKRL